MTELEQAAARAISPDRVTYIPGSCVKRFARNLSAQAENDLPCITDKQAVALWRQLYRYRRQIKDKNLVEMAQKFASEAQKS